MSSLGTFEFSEINSVKMTAHITLTVGEWRKLREILKGTNFSNRDGGWTLYHEILSDLLEQADKRIFSFGVEPDKD